MKSDRKSELAKLPQDHPLRNTPLLKIGAGFKTHGKPNFVWIRKSWAIAKNTYNELGDVWTRNSTWVGGDSAEDTAQPPADCPSDQHASQD